MKMKVKIGQIYKSIHSDMQVVVKGKSNDKWKTAILTNKPGVYNGSHTLSNYTIKHKFELIA